MIHWFLLRWLPSRTRPDDREGQAAARGAALLGALSVATVPLVLIEARAATTDMTLTLFISAAVLAMAHADLLRATSTGDRKRVHRCYLLAAVASALAFLTKGPVGAVIPALIWLSYHALQRDLLPEIRRVPWAKMLGLFVLIAAPWYVATYLVDGPAFLKHFFMTENIGRFTTVMEGHGASNGQWGRLQGLIVYWPIALLVLFPYSPFILHEALVPFAGNRTLCDNEVLVRLRRFAWCWLVAVIVLFSLSRTQLPSYIQSMLGAAGILFAVHVLGRLSPDTIAVQRPAAPAGIPRWWMAGEAALLTVIAAAIVYYLDLGLLKNGITLVQWVPPAPFPHGQALLLAALLGICGGFFVLGTCYWGVRRRSAPFIAWVMATWTLMLIVLALGVGPLAVCSNYRLMAMAGTSVRALPAKYARFRLFRIGAGDAGLLRAATDRALQPE